MDGWEKGKGFDRPAPLIKFGDVICHFLTKYELERRLSISAQAGNCRGLEAQRIIVDDDCKTQFYIYWALC